MKKKFSISEIKVKSFVISQEKGHIVGGYTGTNCSIQPCPNTYPKDCTGIQCSGFAC